MHTVGLGVVTHRIGGLEKTYFLTVTGKEVIHRIGGLEMIRLIYLCKIVSYTPHRWLRKHIRGIVIRISSVIHRIGGLENISGIYMFNTFVIHRIGGLENFGGV